MKEWKYAAVLLTASTNFNVDMHVDVYESVWFKIGMMIDTIVRFDTGLIGLDHRNARKKNFCANCLKSL